MCSHAYHFLEAARHEFGFAGILQRNLAGTSILPSGLVGIVVEEQKLARHGNKRLLPCFRFSQAPGTLKYLKSYSKGS